MADELARLFYSKTAPARFAILARNCAVMSTWWLTFNVTFINHFADSMLKQELRKLETAKV